LPETDLALLIDAARHAGDIARKYFQNDPDVTDKPDGAGPVTEADLAVNAQLETTLRLAQPAYGWLSEETEDNTARLTTKRQFVIDPIDGTRAFINHSNDWAHALAVVKEGEPIAAVVYLPMHDLMFAAAKGEGATVNGAPIAVTSTQMAQATVLAARPNYDPVLWRGGKPPEAFGGMLTLRPSWEWDIAAGALIITEAGGTVTDQHGAPLQFNNQHPQVPGVVAAGAPLHADLLARLEPQGATS
jgi:myo-inositol-1(or 4)-monophosphatase